MPILLEDFMGLITQEAKVAQRKIKTLSGANLRAANLRGAKIRVTQQTEIISALHLQIIK